MAFRRPAKMRSNHHIRTTAMKLFGSKGKMETPEQREEMATIFAMSSDPRFRELAKQSRDQLCNGARSFAWLAEHLNLSYPAIAKEYTELQKSIGYTRAAAHLPDLMEQVMVDAKSVTASCPDCQGTGEVLGPKSEDGAEAVATIPCSSCGGAGEHYIPGDIDRLKLALETFQLVGAKPSVAVNFDMSGSGRGEGLGDLATSVSTILEGNAQRAVNYASEEPLDASTESPMEQPPEAL